MTQTLPPKERKNRNTWDRRFRYRVKGWMPGQIGRENRRKYRRLFQHECDAEFQAALTETAGLVMLDLGGNVGEYAVRMAASGGPVHSFEPDPWTCAKLQQATANLPNVTVHQAAAGAQDGTTQFYRRKDFEDDPDKHSVAASTVAGKVNMDLQTSFDVAQIDIARFIAELDTDVGVMKIDIEGGEVALLETLLDSPALQRVRYVFCETHETMIPALATRTEALRKRVKSIQTPKFNMDWY